LLKKELLAKYPVSVWRVEVPRDEFGHCQLNGRKFKIYIDRHLPEWLAIEVLIHEWSHCISWSRAYSEQDLHNDSWGIAYSKTYRKFLAYKGFIPKTKRAAKIFNYFNI
jgi:hypothetical protein